MEFKGIFSYLISKIDLSIETLSQRSKIGEFFIQTDSQTPLDVSISGEKACAVFGYAVNVYTGDRENLSRLILDNASDVDQVIEYEKKLGGKYLIFFIDKDKAYIIGDATCSIPVYYGVKDSELICASNPKFLVDYWNITPDEDLMNIRRSGDISQAMPYDVTEYKELKQLIPNHYLNLEESKAIRFINSKAKQKAISVEEAVNISVPMIKNVFSLYNQEFDLICPITSGRDSRVVLSFFSAFKGSKIKAYTIRHEGFKSDTQDVVIPLRLCEIVGAQYEQIEDIALATGDIDEVDRLLGKGEYSKRTLMIACTVKEHCKGSAIVNGDVIGQVGKCSLHRDIPSFLATPGYFLCKLHNYSKEAKKLLKGWLEEIKDSQENVNTFDLFSVENRLGRWAGQENLVYNSIGQPYLNIFNSRSIIYTWTAVKRGQRKKSAVHVGIIQRVAPELCGVPFEKDGFLTRLSKANGIFYYLSSRLKHFLEKIKHKRGSK